MAAWRRRRVKGIFQGACLVALAEQISVMASADEVWAMASDPLLVATCIPGATLTPSPEPGTYAGSIKVKFGPTAVTFNGLVTLSYQDRLCRIEGRGRDGRGASNALATGTVAVEGGKPCTLRVEGDFQVSGPLEAFARTGGVHVARALLADFARNLEQRITNQVEAAPGAPVQTCSANPQLEMRGGKLLWLAFRSWLASLFRGRSAL
jgi:carbon monoxide dehydrogenase subunit G